MKIYIPGNTPISIYHHKYYGPTWNLSSAGVLTNPLSIGNGGLGANYVVDGTFDTDIGAGNWTGVNWTIGATGVATHAAGSTDSLTNVGGLAAIVGRFYRCEVDFVRTASGVIMYAGGALGLDERTSGAKSCVIRATSTAKPSIGPTDTNLVGTCDNFVIRPINVPLMFRTKYFGFSTAVTAQVAIANAAVPISYPAGVVICLDSQTNPLNYFCAYLLKSYFGTQVAAIKVVGGVTTAIITAGAVTYTQNSKVSIVKSATEVKVYYDTGDLSNQVGLTYTILAGDPAGQFHGYFSTDSSVLIDTANSVFSGT